MVNKIIQFEKAHTIVSRFSRKRVLAGGCFDILHIGHILFFQKAAKAGDYLIILLESDEFIKKNKDRNPFQPQRERARILSAISSIDAVVPIPCLLSDKEYFDLVYKIKPHIIAVTKGDKQIENKKRQAKGVSGKTLTVTSRIPHKTSSRLRRLINEEF